MNYELRITSLVAEVLEATNYECLCTNNKRHFECKTNQFPNHAVSNAEFPQGSNSELRSIKSSSVKFPQGSNSESRSAKFPKGSNLHKQSNCRKQCQGKG